MISETDNIDMLLGIFVVNEHDVLLLYKECIVLDINYM